MAPHQTNQGASLNPIPTTAQSLALWGRPLAVAASGLFLISSAFPIVAGLSKNTASFPEWWGMLDVSIALLLTILAIVIVALVGRNVNKPAEEASYRTYRVLTHGILAMIVVFFLFGDRIVWTNCLTGFAWRTWLLLYSLPAWFTALGTEASPAGPGRKE